MSVAVTSTMNDVVLVQLKALDDQTRSLAEQVTANNLSQSGQELKMGNMQEMYSKHMTLMEQLNRKCDAQATVIVENRKVFTEKIKTFESELIEELKKAT